MPLHRIAEIFHALALRGSRVPAAEAGALVEAMIAEPQHCQGPCIPQHYVGESTSARTGIHIWVYLRLLPAKDYVEVVCSTDPRFDVVCWDRGLRLVNPSVTGQKLSKSDVRTATASAR